MKIRTKILGIVILALMGIGCASKQPQPVLPPAPSIHQLMPSQVQKNSGSLFQEDNARFLFADSRARRVGDIVVVNIVENVSAKNKATTKAKKSSSLNLGINNFFGQQHLRLFPLGNVMGGGPSAGPRMPVGSAPIVSATSTSDFKGDGETIRESDITASVAARVVRVLPGGLLQIEGARRIKVNNETQIIVVRGLARPRDIGPDNTISSNYLADAQIEIYGQGVLADKQKPGWLTRLLENIWPF